MAKKAAEKKGNPLVRFLKWAFVKNIGLKIGAIFMAVAIWMIITIL
ncbi:MAG: hypothetical protein IJD07_03420 [Clostridia bacterium]|nr:hypothetical protein [Clostridia bacterium]